MSIENLENDKRLNEVKHDLVALQAHVERLRTDVRDGLNKIEELQLAIRDFIREFQGPLP